MLEEKITGSGFMGLWVKDRPQLSKTWREFQKLCQYCSNKSSFRWTKPVPVSALPLTELLLETCRFNAPRGHGQQRNTALSML